MVYSVSCGHMAASQLAMECTLRLAGRTQADLCFPPVESAVNALPKSLFCLLGGVFSFSLSSNLGALGCVGFPRHSAVLASWSQGKPSPLSELSSSGVSEKDLCDPRGSLTSVSRADLGIVLL